MSTQLISADSYDTSRMRFSEPIEGSIPDSVISYKRVNISTVNDDGSIGELVIPTEELYSYGVSENKNMQTGNVDGYVFPLVLYNKNGASESEKAFVNTFNNIVEKCKDYLIDNKDDLGQYDLERNDLKKLNPIYYKRDKGKIVEGSPPTLYAKLIVKKDKKEGNKILTSFFDKETGNDVNALRDLLGKHCYGKGVIKIESIFIGNKISLQVKLYECEVKLIDSGIKRLLPRIKPVETKISVSTKNDVVMPLNDDDDDDDNNSIVNDDKDDDAISIGAPVEETIKPIPKKTVTRKVVNKKAKKDE